MNVNYITDRSNIFQEHYSAALTLFLTLFLPWRSILPLWSPCYWDGLVSRLAASDIVFSIFERGIFLFFLKMSFSDCLWIHQETTRSEKGENYSIVSFDVVKSIFWIPQSEPIQSEPIQSEPIQNMQLLLS